MSIAPQHTRLQTAFLQQMSAAEGASSIPESWQQAYCVANVIEACRECKPLVSMRVSSFEASRDDQLLG